MYGTETKSDSFASAHCIFYFLSNLIYLDFTKITPSFFFIEEALSNQTKEINFRLNSEDFVFK